MTAARATLTNLGRARVGVAPQPSITRWYPSLRDVTIAGRRLRYLDAGAGPALLLIHGIGGSWTHWAANLDALTRRHRVIAVDLPGFGASEALAPRSELGMSAEALLELLDRCGISRFAAVGHSLGGLLAWGLAVVAPERVTHLGLVDAATVPLSPFRTGLIVHSFTLMSRFLSRPTVARALLYRPRPRHFALSILLGDPDAVTREFALALLAPLTAAPGFLDALWAGPRANRTLRPEDLHTPMLIVWGTKDPIFSVRSARRLAARLPNAAWLEIPGARHCPMLEQPDRFNAALGAFLAGQ